MQELILLFFINYAKIWCKYCCSKAFFLYLHASLSELGITPIICPDIKQMDVHYEKVSDDACGCLLLRNDNSSTDCMF